MADAARGYVVAPVTPRDRQVRALIEALTVELAAGGYTPDQTFGYSAEQLERSDVHLVGARIDDRLVAIAGIQVQSDGVAELKRFYVIPQQRGTGAADVLIAALLAHAAARQVRIVRLETGDRQQAAQAFYRRHGFAEVARFDPYLNSATSVCMQLSL